MIAEVGVAILKFMHNFLTKVRLHHRVALLVLATGTIGGGVLALSSTPSSTLPPLALDAPLFQETSSRKEEETAPTPLPKTAPSATPYPLQSKGVASTGPRASLHLPPEVKSSKPAGKIVGLTQLTTTAHSSTKERGTTPKAQAVEALREIARESNDSPPRSGGGGGDYFSGRSAPRREREDEEKQDEKEVDLATKVGGQARGFTLLPLLNPRARASIDAQVETLKRANLDETYLGVLTDETFSLKFDNEYFASILKKLSSPDRAVILQLYLTNGPTMREWNRTTINASFNKMPPGQFRSEIQSDDWTRRKFTNLVIRVKDIVDLHRSLSPRNRVLVSVMLEDNLDDPSYRAARQIAARELKGVEFVRNPCSCGLTGTNDDPTGDKLELHQLEHLGRLRPGDGYTLDGVGYTYGTPNELSKLTVEGVRSAIERARGQGLSFFSLWRASRQGLYTPGVREHPNKRNFEVPSEEEMKIDISLLRHGLDPRP